MNPTLEDLTDRVAEVADIYAAEFGIERDADWYLLKVQEELGELTQQHLKLTGRARGSGDEAARADEAADVLCMLLLYCRRHGIDLDKAVERKWLRWLEPA